MKTSELTGPQLDEWVAKAEGVDKLPGYRVGSLGPEREYEHILGYVIVDHLTYSSRWERAGPIIERELIEISPLGDRNWMASVRPEYAGSELIAALSRGIGPTPIIAAMRAYVASKFGDEISE